MCATTCGSTHRTLSDKHFTGRRKLNICNRRRIIACPKVGEKNFRLIVTCWIKSTRCCQPDRANNILGRCCSSGQVFHPDRVIQSFFYRIISDTPHTFAKRGKTQRSVISDHRRISCCKRISRNGRIVKTINETGNSIDTINHTIFKVGDKEFVMGCVITDVPQSGLNSCPITIRNGSATDRGSRCLGIICCRDEH